MPTNTRKEKRLEFGSKLLLFFGFACIIACGIVALVLGGQQAMAGNIESGAGLLAIALIVFLAAGFMVKDLK